MLIDPFTAAIDSCMYGKDSDSNGSADDNCGTPSLKVTNDPSGTITDISSICHEGCEID